MFLSTAKGGNKVESYTNQWCPFSKTGSLGASEFPISGVLLVEGMNEPQADSVGTAQGIAGLADVQGFLKLHASITSS